MSLEQDVSDIKQTLYGNGQMGLKETVSRLDERIKTLDISMNDLKTVISGLTQFMNEVQGGKKKTKMIQWLIGILVTTNIGFITAIIMILT